MRPGHEAPEDGPLAKQASLGILTHHCEHSPFAGVLGVIGSSKRRRARLHVHDC